MKDPIQLAITNPSVRNPLSLSRDCGTRVFLLLALALTGFALSPLAQAVSPPPDGAYPNFNTAEGEDALFSLAGGLRNTAIGFNALYLTTDGYDNTATGFRALLFNTDGYSNTAVGVYALFSNTTGYDNTATGDSALQSNTTGAANTANGAFALQNNSIGNNNTANGVDALPNNTTGVNNTANGFAALFYNNTGSNNIANGYSALFNNTTGSNNIAFGVSAGENLMTGNDNIFIGNSGSNPGESGKIRIGTKGTHKNTAIAGISGVIVANGVGVIINPQGQLGTVVSSARYKDAIQPMDKASESILSLKPVTFRYKKELDPDGIPQFGLVAEQVEKVNPDLVARDEQGKPYTVRYEAVNAMLLNEFLKEHRTVENLSSNEQGQRTTIARLDSTVAAQEATIARLEVIAAQQQKEIHGLRTQIQKVGDQLEATRTAPTLAINQ